MAETKRNIRDDLRIFRERMGGISEAKKAWSKEQRTVLKAIREALKNGPRTVPALAAETHLPGHQVLWYLMGMKRYGQVTEAGMEGDYFRYQIKEAS